MYDIFIKYYRYAAQEIIKRPASSYIIIIFRPCGAGYGDVHIIIIRAVNGSKTTYNVFT